MERFEHLKNLNIQSSCRTCLENINEMHQNIFTIPNLVHKFTVCTSLPVELDDGYPTNICEPCHAKINDFYNFQQMCISARKKFQDCINKDGSKKLSTDLISFTEPKEEREDDSFSNDKYSGFLEPELSNVKSQDDNTSSEDDTEESDDNQPILKYRDSNKNNSNKEKTLIDNANIDEDVKTNDNKKTNSTSMDKINLECEICNKNFKKLKTFEEHMCIHQGIKPFSCQQCDKSFARPGRLKVHIRVKHEGKSFTCTEPGCDKNLSSKQTLRQHISEIHCGTNINNGVKTKQLYICEECGKVLKGLSTLKNHRFLHSGQPRPHACPQCHKRYMTRCKLKDHMNRHAGIKNFVCPHCGAKKSSRSELKNHVNYHTKEKTYPCHICNMVFNNIVNYSRHRRVVHEGIKNFPCSYCDKSFGKSETRKHHEMTHTGEKPHECKVCHKKFIQIVSLKKHQKVHLKAQANGL